MMFTGYLRFSLACHTSLSKTLGVTWAYRSAKPTRRFLRRHDLPIDQHPARVTAAGLKLPRNVMPFTSELGPARVLAGILFEPNVTIVGGE
jgi:hypothetical protein